MRIRCQNCQALFWLQEGISGAGGRVLVQCGRCLAVFEAAQGTPPPAASDAGERAPRQPDPHAARLPTSGTEAATRASSGRARRLRWMAVLTAAALLAGAGVAIYGRVAALPREVAAKLAQGRERMLRDDGRSLDEATRLFTEAVRIAPGEATPEGERAFALLLQAAAHKDLAQRVDPPERDDEARLAARFLHQGTAAAKQAFAESQRDAPALRALALSEAIAGDTAPASEHAAQAQRLSPDDPWSLYAQAAAAKAGKGSATVLDALSRLGAAHPNLLRAQVDLGAMLADRGDSTGAREVLRRVVDANGQHERARRMLRLLPPGVP